MTLTPFETAIKTFLDDYAKGDEAFAKKYANPDKSVAECCRYITQEVRKNAKGFGGCAVCTDEEVYGMAIHYYDEADIKVDAAPAAAVVTPPAQTEETEKAGPAEEKPKAKRTRKPKAKAEPQPEPEPEVEEIAAEEDGADPDIPEPLVIPVF